MAGAALGLAAVMHAHLLVFEMLQWFGSVYLCWLGIQLLRSPVSIDASASDQKKSGRLYFR
jgi:threonine/homoserine/homoserine lactone efflux protein